jgi:septal ring factor EnvC (AmiA/AmiB activator)
MPHHMTLRQHPAHRLHAAHATIDRVEKDQPVNQTDMEALKTKVKDLKEKLKHEHKHRKHTQEKLDKLIHRVKHLKDHSSGSPIKRIAIALLVKIFAGLI